MTKFNIDFCAKRNLFFAISLCMIIAVTVGSFVLGVNLDIEFKGGALITYSYEGEINSKEFETFVEGTLGQGVSVQESEDVSTGKAKFVVSLASTEGIDSDAQLALVNAITSEYSTNNIQTDSINVVNPTIGLEFLAKSLVALGFASVLMMIYISIRFSKISGMTAGITAVVALLHDIVIVFGVFVFMGFDINANFIAVSLTILGYSLSDTIVIYDRIRENRTIHGDALTIEELVNLSLNQSLKRSIMTSVTTVLAMVVVAGVALHYNISSILTFAIPMIAGMVSGSYSSLCIATNLWVGLEKKAIIKRASAPVVVEVLEIDPDDYIGADMSTYMDVEHDFNEDNYEDPEPKKKKK